MSRDEARIGRLAVRRVAAVGLVVLVLDQLTKRLAVQAVDRGHRETFLPLIDLVHVRNDGVAFSSFAGSPVIVALLVLGALGALTVWFLRNRTRPLAWLATGMLAGGALGNVLDRIVEGAVIDFLKPPNWPAFNLADMSIVLGMILLVVVVERDHRRTQGRGSAGAQTQRG
ncbi:Lipoprotein signal peptidase [Patulibacter medicamentivorans]|uniref:Lipoprotein signal peptidase n=1 Tax=Patulibacter medicamentivorans TaxID=1097667 RepID=H0E785_9ACTN|nr:signal peptidase II [Patulibacter medicamentivorans]EHN10460.1 Lipoprotein signal peptidase [Patulibacter medicamentivorans]